MHLSAIKLRGFKSFPDPVELRLEPGVAVVVGPNGSGKSNVADAIIWAAGSLSPTELRAEKPDDVLFAGGHGREPAAFCEVELVFDNADGAASVPFAELSIARRLHRGGEGQYLVNGTSVRRTDLVELLADLGLGAAMHSIVGQGRVEEILGASPERRRQLVEEAAGLGRFKRQRHRAELKLARVAAQLERARDVEAEVRARLRPLALQASAAARAERLGWEAAAIAARIAALDLEDAAGRRAALDERRSAAALARRLADERLDALLADRARAEDELGDAAGRREAATASLYRLRGGLERLDVRREAVEGALADVRAALEQPADPGPGTDELAAARAEAEAAAAERERTADARTAAAEDRRAAAGEREAIVERGHRLRRARDRVELAREAAGALVAATNAEADEAAQFERPAGPTRSELGREAERAHTGVRAARTLAEELGERLRLVGERIAAVDRTLAEREGLAPAARALAERGERLAFASARPDPGLERAVAAALGSAASAIVAPDAHAGLTLLRRARDEGLGGLVVVVDASAQTLVADTEIVDADELLTAGRRAVTRDGFGYDPERGELWFVGEAAEALLLELESRRRDLAAEADELERRRRSAVTDAARAAEAAAAADEALAGAPPERRSLDVGALRTATRLGERLSAALAAASADAAALEQRLDQRAGALAARLAAATTELEAAGAREAELRGRAAALHERLQDLQARTSAARGTDHAGLHAVAGGLEQTLTALAAGAAVGARLEPKLRARVDAGGERTRGLADELRRLAAAEVDLRRAAGDAGERLAAADIELARIDAEADDARRRLAESGAEPAEGDDREALAVRLERIARRREELGRVNPLAREEYERERERLDELVTQRGDVEASLVELERLRAELTETVERTFTETFAAVEGHFREVAGTLFPGGEGRLALTDPDDEAPAGVEVELRPAGKRITRLSLLSGGEKSLGAISFLFALFLARPCPFYLLDEVEAALDDANIGRFVGLLRRYADRAQFVVITHQKRTIEAADILYGVTMAPDGVSQIVSRRLPREDAAAVAG